MAGEPVVISDPEKYRGIYRDLKVDLKTEIRKLRDEWRRIGCWVNKEGVYAVDIDENLWVTPDDICVPILIDRLLSLKKSV